MAYHLCSLFFLRHGLLGKKYGMTLDQLASLWNKKPAKLAGLELKRAIAKVNHADIVVWEPDAEFELDENYATYLKHPNM